MPASWRRLGDRGENGALALTTFDTADNCSMGRATPAGFASWMKMRRRPGRGVNAR
jgi:hypothetical protein